MLSSLIRHEIPLLFRDTLYSVGSHCFSWSPRRGSSKMVPWSWLTGSRSRCRGLILSITVCTCLLNKLLDSKTCPQLSDELRNTSFLFSFYSPQYFEKLFYEVNIWFSVVKRAWDQIIRLFCCRDQLNWYTDTFSRSQFIWRYWKTSYHGGLFQEFYTGVLMISVHFRHFIIWV